MSSAEDILLIARVVIGDKRAFDCLVVRYQESLRRFFLNLTLGNRSLADDLAQETFIKAYLYIRSFHGRSQFQTWLFTIARRVFYDYMAGQHPTEALPDTIAGEQDASHIDLYIALRQLSVKERMAIELYYFEGLDQKAIARVMECPLGTVKTHLSRGKEKMTKLLTV